MHRRDREIDKRGRGFSVASDMQRIGDDWPRSVARGIFRLGNSSCSRYVYAGFGFNWYKIAGHAWFGYT